MKSLNTAISALLTGVVTAIPTSAIAKPYFDPISGNDGVAAVYQVCYLQEVKSSTQGDDAADPNFAQPQDLLFKPDGLGVNHEEAYSLGDGGEVVASFNRDVRLHTNYRLHLFEIGNRREIVEVEIGNWMGGAPEDGGYFQRKPNTHSLIIDELPSGQANPAPLGMSISVDILDFFDGDIDELPDPEGDEAIIIDAVRIVDLNRGTGAGGEETTPDDIPDEEPGIPTGIAHGADIDAVGIDCTRDPNAITLRNFDVTTAPGKNILNWSTGAELDSDKVEILRAKVTIHSVETVGEVASKGNIFTGASYQFEDNDVEPGAAYIYGLKEIGSDGETEIHLDMLRSAIAE